MVQCGTIQKPLWYSMSSKNDCFCYPSPVCLLQKASPLAKDIRLVEQCSRGFATARAWSCSAPPSPSRHKSGQWCWRPWSFSAGTPLCMDIGFGSLMAFLVAFFFFFCFFTLLCGYHAVMLLYCFFWAMLWCCCLVVLLCCYIVIFLLCPIVVLPCLLCYNYSVVLLF